MDKYLRTEIVAEVKKSMTEILEVANERWLTGDELCEQFQMFSKGWLKAYGDRLPRQRAEVMEGISAAQDRPHDSGWNNKATLRSTVICV